MEQINTVVGCMLDLPRKWDGFRDHHPKPLIQCAREGQRFSRRRGREFAGGSALLIVLFPLMKGCSLGSQPSDGEPGELFPEMRVPISCPSFSRGS